MDRDSHKARAESFGSVAELYERARPAYADDAVDWLLGSAPRDVIDLGAGTGKLTRQIVARGHRTTAIDPSPEMLAILRAALPNVPTHLASAEDMPLPDASADVIAVGQAFHWFDKTRSLREMARVLRPNGYLALVWNIRDDAEPWVARLSSLIGSEHSEDRHIEEALAKVGHFGPLAHRSFRHSARHDRDCLLALVRSRSFCATRRDDERREILTSVAALYDEFAARKGASEGASENSSEGSSEGASEGLLLPYVTQCFRAARR